MAKIKVSDIEDVRTYLGYIEWVLEGLVYVPNFQIRNRSTLLKSMQTSVTHLRQNFILIRRFVE